MNAAIDRPTDIPDGHLHQSQLLDRGWTRDLIKAELRSHAVRTETVIDACTSPLWYPVAAVETAEAGDAYQAHQAAVAAEERERREHARARRAAAAPAVAERNAQIAELDSELVQRRGRRLYVRCGYESRLGVALRGIGASWDRDEKCLWIGTGKADQLPPLLAAHQERKRSVADTLAAELWVTIPYSCEQIRTRAKALGAVWEPERKQWAMPNRESHSEITTLLAAEAEREAAVAAAREKAAAARKAAAAQRAAMDAAARAEVEKLDAEARRAKLLAESGRTPTGETEQVVYVSVERMNKQTARTRADIPGALIDIGDGRRGIVLEADVWFTNGDNASSMCWHPETHDEAHWDFRYEVAVVEPTDEEAARDAARRAAEADTRRVHDLFRRLGRTGEASEDWSRIPEAGVVGTIRHRYGSGYNDGGQVILTPDRVVFQHPGFYDDWRRTERVFTDAETVAEVRDIIIAGDRELSHSDQIIYRYTIKGAAS